MTLVRRQTKTWWSAAHGHHLGRSRMIHTRAEHWFEHCHCLKESSHTFAGLDDSIFLLCLHCWFLPPQRSFDCLNAITWAVNGNAPDQSDTSTSDRTEICCWNMIFSLFVEISSPHSEMKINGCICHPQPIYQLVDVAAGWIDFFFCCCCWKKRKYCSSHLQATS